MTDRRQWTSGALPGPDLPADDADTALAGILLALAGGRRLVVLSGNDGAMRVDLLVRLARHLECEGTLVLGASGSGAATVEDIVESAGRSGLGDATSQLGFDALLAALDEKLERSGVGILVVDDAHRLASETLADLLDLPTSETETGRFIQLVLAGDRSLTGRLAPHLPHDDPAVAASRFQLVDATNAGTGRASGGWASSRGTWGRIVVALAVASVGVTGVWLAGPWLLPRSDAAPSLEAAQEVRSRLSAPEPGLRLSNPELDTGQVRPPPVEAVVDQAATDITPPMVTDLEPSGDAASSTPSGPDTTPTPAPPLIDTPPGDLVAELLAEAEARFAANRLTTPEGGSAADSLQAVLALDPGNGAVADLRARMLATYRRWAAAAERRGDWGIARLFYRRALRVEPDDPGMTRLLETLPDRQRQNRPLPAIPPVRTETVPDPQRPPVPRLR